MRISAPTTDTIPESGYLNVHQLSGVTGCSPKLLWKSIKANRFGLKDMTNMDTGVILFPVNSKLKKFIDQQRAIRAHLKPKQQTQVKP